jgi:hypothetical protein
MKWLVSSAEACFSESETTTDIMIPPPNKIIGRAVRKCQYPPNRMYKENAQGAAVSLQQHDHTTSVWSNWLQKQFWVGHQVTQLAFAHWHVCKCTLPQIEANWGMKWTLGFQTPLPYKAFCHAERSGVHTQLSAHKFAPNLIVTLLVNEQQTCSSHAAWLTWYNIAHLSNLSYLHFTHEKHDMQDQVHACRSLMHKVHGPAV